MSDPLSDDQMPPTSSPQDGPWLWNPDVAAVLSLLGFSASFGAAVHAANWRRLGQHRQMWSSLMWAVALPIFLLALAALEGTHRYRRFAALAIIAHLVAWYCLSGRKQSKYIVFTLNKRYRRESWVIPFGLVALYYLPAIVQVL